MSSFLNGRDDTIRGVNVGATPSSQASFYETYQRKIHSFNPIS